MTDNFVLFVGGVLAGLGTALPIGPTNLWVIRAALPPPRSHPNVAAFVVGLLFFDTFYAALGYWGYAAWFASSTYAEGVMFVGGCGLILLGSHGVWKAMRAGRELALEAGTVTSLSNGSSPSLLADLSMGFVLGSNPSFIPYWIVAVSTAVSYVGGALSGGQMLLVFGGIVFGDILWYATLFQILRKYSRIVSPSAVYWMQLGIAFTFTGAGIVLLFKSVQ